MNIAILDLEWNAAYSRKLKGYINEIIEFGAVKCGENFQPADTFSCFVRPQVGKRLNSVVAGLTSITQENLTAGIPFMQAVSRFKHWLGYCVVMTWGSGDILTLIENCRYFSGSGQVPFLTRYCDLQRFAQERLGLGTGEQAGLEKVANLLGLDISQMEHHRALDDSLVTLQVLGQVSAPAISRSWMILRSGQSIWPFCAPAAGPRPGGPANGPCATEAFGQSFAAQAAAGGSLGGY